MTSKTIGRIFEEIDRIGIRIEKTCETTDSIKAQTDKDSGGINSGWGTADSAQFDTRE